MVKSIVARANRALMFGVSAAALSFAAQAQDASTPEEEGQRGATSIFIEEIAITATKKTRGESIQDVPIAITAFGEAQLDALKVRSLQNLSYSMPNVQLEDIGTVKGFANFSIRGFGVNSSIPSIDPSVGVFVDGMYLGINGGVVFDTFDIGSIEVLRGPQGVLFGRNVTGGAVVVNTTKPTEEWTGKVKTAVESGLRGTGESYYAMGRVSGALVPGKFRIKLAGFFNEDEGWHENLADGENIGGSRTIIGRAAFTAVLSESAELTVRYEHGDLEGDGPAAQNRSIFDRNTFDLAIDEVGFQDTVWDQVNAELTWDIGEGRLTNIFAWRDIEIDAVSDIDARPDGSIIVGFNPATGPVIAPLPFLFHSFSGTRQDQWSNELRYSTRLYDRTDLTVGAYIFDQNLTYQESRYVPPSGDFSGGGTQSHTTLGLFANADVELTEKWTLTLGGRLTYEEKQAQVVTLPFNLQPSGFRVQTPVAPGLCNVLEDIGQCRGVEAADEDWTFFTPKIGAKYDVNENTHIYAHWSRAFRAGGFNLRRTLPTRGFGFDPEKIDNFEVGFKYQSDDRRIRINGAAFLSPFDDLQRDVNLADPLVGVGQATLNTADGEVMGIELDGQWVVTDNFILTGHIGLLDGDYHTIREDISFDPNVDPITELGLIDERDLALDLPRLADVTWGVGAIYDQDLGEAGLITYRANFNHRAETPYTDNNAGFINAANILDASINWQLPGEQWTASIFGRNILNEVTAGGDTQLPLVFQDPVQRNGNAPTFSPLNRGAVFGLELQYDF